MRIFITGASGYIGHAVAKAFRTKGHIVYGLVRSEEDAHLLSLDEITPIIGKLEETESYRSILQEIEVAVHCAFDFTEKGIELDAKTIDFILDNFSRSALPRTFIYTSGVWVYGSLGNKIANESMPLNPLEIVKWRPKHEEKVIKATSPTLRTVILRPGHVYGGVGGLTNHLFASTQNGKVSMVGEGNNHWPMVHLQDLAYAYVSAAEKELSRVVLNVVDDSNFTLKEICEAVAKAANLEGKVAKASKEEAEKEFGMMVPGFLIDLTVDNSRIKRLLGWQIHHAPFVYEAELYYHAWETAMEGANTF